MIYEKRLLVLAGEENGCLRLERTSSALAGRLTGNVRGDCVLAVTAGGKLYTFGRFTLSSAYSFTLPPDIELDSFVAAVGDMHGRCIMSGGFKRPMPWRSNMEDWLRRAVRACGANPDGVESAPEAKRNIDDYFLDIVPQEYDDGKIAEVNYYRSNLTSEPPENHAAQSSGGRGSYVSGQEQSARQDSDKAYSAQPLSASDISGDPGQHTGVGDKELFQSQRMHASERTIRPIHADGHERFVRPANSDEQEMRRKQPGASAAAEPVATPDDGHAEREAAASVTDGPPLSDADYGARKVPELGRATFYESVSDQLQKLFDKCERYTALEKLLPDSRWIKVDYDTSGRYYLVGLIGDPVRYMCYGVPGEYSPEPPPELAGYCQWLAADPNDPAGKGFWIMYQDGVTGKSIL